MPLYCLLAALPQHPVRLDQKINEEQGFYPFQCHVSLLVESHQIHFFPSLLSRLSCFVLFMIIYAHKLNIFCVLLARFVL